MHLESHQLLRYTVLDTETDTTYPASDHYRMAVLRATLIASTLKHDVLLQDTVAERGRVDSWVVSAIGATQALTLA